jgi:hypothetical protein
LGGGTTLPDKLLELRSKCCSFVQLKIIISGTEPCKKLSWSSRETRDERPQIVLCNSPLKFLLEMSRPAHK